jgi:hypothetical protein
MPAEVEGRVGGSVVHHYGAEAGSGTVTDYDSPHRFAYEEEVALGEDQPTRPIAAIGRQFGESAGAGSS